MSDWVHVEGHIDFAMKDTRYNPSEAFSKDIPTGSEGKLTFRVEDRDRSYFAPKYRVFFYTGIRDRDASYLPTVVAYLNRATTEVIAHATFEASYLVVRQSWQPDIELKWDGKTWKATEDSAIALAKLLNFERENFRDYTYVMDEALAILSEMAAYLPPEHAEVAKAHAERLKTLEHTIRNRDLPEDES